MKLLSLSALFVAVKYSLLVFSTAAILTAAGCGGSKYVYIGKVIYEPSEIEQCLGSSPSFTSCTSNNLADERQWSDASKFGAAECSKFIKAEGNFTLLPSDKVASYWPGSKPQRYRDELATHCEALWVSVEKKKGNADNKQIEIASGAAKEYFESCVKWLNDPEARFYKSNKECLPEMHIGRIWSNGRVERRELVSARESYPYDYWAYLSYRKLQDKDQTVFERVAVAACEEIGAIIACEDAQKLGLGINLAKAHASDISRQQASNEMAKYEAQQQREDEQFKRDYEARWAHVGSSSSIAETALSAATSVAATAAQSRAQVAATKQGMILPPARTGDPIQDTMAQNAQNMEAIRQNMAIQEQNRKIATLQQQQSSTSQPGSSTPLAGTGRTAPPSTALKQEESYSCWDAPASCIQATTDWSRDGSEFHVRYRNTCSKNIYVRVCNAQKNGGWDCGDDDAQPGQTHTATTYGGTATGVYRMYIAGSAKPNDDWICVDSQHANWPAHP